MIELEEKNKCFLIVAENFKKKYYINKFKNKLLNINYISTKDFLNRFFFKVKKEAIFKVVSYFNLPFQEAKVYLDNILVSYLAQGKTNLKDIDKYKEDMAIKIYEYLDKEEMIERDSLFNVYLKGKTVLLTEESAFLSKIIGNIDYDFINLEPSNASNISSLVVQTYRDTEDELFMTFERISKLVSQGTPLCDIYIVASDDYSYQIDDMANYYNLKCNHKANKPLLYYKKCRELLDDYFSSNFESKSQDQNYHSLYNKVLNVLNKYDYMHIENKALLREVIEEELKVTKVEAVKFTNAIHLVTLDEVMAITHKHIFILNFEDGILPRQFRDDDFFSDDLKKRCCLLTSTDKTELEEQKIYNILGEDNKYYLSYTIDSKVAASSLIKKFNMQLKKNEVAGYSHFSNRYNKKLLAAALDEFSKYHIRKGGVERLKATYKDIPYLGYSNKFSGLNNTNFIKSLKGKLSLSYSSMDNYYQCPFAYYVNHILHLDEYQITFPTLIGSIFHQVLEECLSGDKDIDESFAESKKASMGNYKMCPSDEFLLSELKVNLREAIDIIRAQYKDINYLEELHEQRIVIADEQEIETEKIAVRLTGIIDKLLYKEVKNEQGQVVSYFSVVDYKTTTSKSTIDLGLDLIEYGLHMQLFVYLYLVQNSNVLVNPQVGGFFLQPILSSTILSADSAESLEDQKNKLYQFRGYVNSSTLVDDTSFDKSYQNSSIIKGLKQKKDGTFTKVALSSAEIKEYTAKIEYKYKEAVDNILGAKFDIAPKNINGNRYNSCTYCKYRDLCYRKDSDIVYISQGDTDE